LETAADRCKSWFPSDPGLSIKTFYGIDFPTSTELLAAEREVDEIRDFLELDSIGYLSVGGLLSSLSGPPENYCTACWTGDYIVPIEKHLGRYSRRRKK
jgi:amidophosphoribosyltransferase